MSRPALRGVMLLVALLSLGPGAQAAPPPAGDDGDLLPQVRAPSPEELARAQQLTQELERRRSLLQIHQGVGIALLTSLAATAVLGQLNYSDKYGGGGDTGKWHTAHQVSAYTSSALFAGAGVLALLAPKPFVDSRGSGSSATWHKVAMATATAGMVGQVVLGIVASRSEGQLRQRDFALAHQLLGYTTVAATGAGVLVFAF